MKKSDAVYEFIRDVSVEGRPFKAGQQIADGDIPADHRDCCLRLGYLKEVPQAAAAKK